MKSIQQYIASQQSEFARHPFFARLESSMPLPHVLAFAPDLTFWVMVFQDILRLNERFTTDPELRRIVKHHRVEDSGHEQWFLEDLAVMGSSSGDIRWLFGKRHAPTRDAAHALMAEVFRASDDRLRVVLLMTLESAGHIFFERVARFVDGAGKSDVLKYFSFSHLAVEKNHEVFEKQIAEKLDAIVLSPDLRAQAEAVVDRCYAAFRAMFEAMSVAAPLETSGFALDAPAARLQMGN
jgi:hypothetical protein